MKRPNRESKELSRSQQRRRQDIIQAAIKLFDRDGFEAARMSDIAQEADVAKGTLYLYFDTKIALLEGVVEAVIFPTLEIVGEAAQTQSGTAEEILKAQIRIIIRRMASPEMKTLLRLMITGRAKHPKISKFYYENVIQPGLKLFKKTLMYGVERGEFRAQAAKIDPLVLVGANVYTAVWKILFDDLSPIDLEKLIEDHVDLFLHGLLIGR